MRIRVYNNCKSIEGKRATKVISTLSSYLFEADVILKESEKKQIRDTIKVLNNIIERN